MIIFSNSGQLHVQLLQLEDQAAYLTARHWKELYHEVCCYLRTTNKN